jgi:hypothetical protein
MFDLASLRLMHPHGDEMVPMLEVSRQTFHDSAEFDSERDFLRSGMRIFQCTRCKELVHIADPASGPGAEE